ncbi:hypothetical protein GINT2_002185 [Glugoides intestinalis]
MLLLHFLFLSAFLPLRLKEFKVVLSSQKYPTRVLTIGKSDLIHKKLKMLEVEHLRKEQLENQLFKLQEAWNGGIVLKSTNELRSFRHFDTLKLTEFQTGIDNSVIHIVKSGKTYPGTFQIVCKRECLDALENEVTGKTYVKFNECSNTDSQLWGAFSETQARRYLGMTHSNERDERELKRLIDFLHEKYFEKAVK